MFDNLDKDIATEEIRKIKIDCPFCPGELYVIAEEDYSRTGMKETYFVECHVCGGKGPRRATIKDAIASFELKRLQENKKAKEVLSELFERLEGSITIDYKNKTLAATINRLELKKMMKKTKAFFKI